MNHTHSKCGYRRSTFLMVAQSFYYSLVILLTVFFVSPFHGYAQTPKALKLINLRLVGDLERTRLIAVFNAKPEFTSQLLDKPPRLVINLPEVDFSAQNEAPEPRGMVKRLRYGISGPQTSRIIINTKTPFVIEKADIQQLNGGLWQLVIDLTATDQKKYQESLKEQKDTIQSEIIEQKPIMARAFRVVIDAGHGGIDSGAKGISGVLEKNVTLAFARSLRDELEKKPAITVFLTRDSDVFLRLNERVQIARAHGADLFISIHADTINTSVLRGSTVYTISDKASDDVARSLAEKENKTDLLDGLPADETPEVTDILIDLTRRETHAFSVNFADRVVMNLTSNNINLIKNPHRYAGFQVLKAPDVPSVLIEIGYLSNKADEQLVTSPVWRQKMASTIAHSVNQFASYRSGDLSKSE